MTTEDDDLESVGRVGIKLSEIPDSNVSVVGHVDHNLLSFVANILMSHNLKSIIMLKKRKPPVKLLESQKKEDEEEEIFVYKPSRAERTFLEERI